MGMLLCLFIDFVMLIASMINGLLNIVPMWYLWVIPIIIIIRYFVSWSNSKKLAPTKKECPICKSTNVDINLVGAGAVGVNVGYGVGVAQTVNAKVAICKDCGASFGFAAQNDIWAVQRSRRNRVILFVIFFVIIVLVGKWYADHKVQVPEEYRTESVK